MAGVEGAAAVLVAEDELVESRQQGERVGGVLPDGQAVLEVGGLDVFDVVDRHGRDVARVDE
ncbi:Uncharacterised protein [Mycobacteroides abscessus subsp. abscessus]|nr:Uncharacterised protein [Mycobacteroides abscessus subsp. abscessus]